MREYLTSKSNKQVPGDGACLVMVHRTNLLYLVGGMELLDSYAHLIVAMAIRVRAAIALTRKSQLP